jgi:hypothetical protein
MAVQEKGKEGERLFCRAGDFGHVYLLLLLLMAAAAAAAAAARAA